MAPHKSLKSFRRQSAGEEASPSVEGTADQRSFRAAMAHVEKSVRVPLVVNRSHGKDMSLRRVGAARHAAVGVAAQAPRGGGR